MTLPHKASAFGPDVLFNFIGAVEVLSNVLALLVRRDLGPTQFNFSRA
jgi:hypothetical protein